MTKSDIQGLLNQFDPRVIEDYAADFLGVSVVVVEQVVFGDYDMQSRGVLGQSAV